LIAAYAGTGIYYLRPNVQYLWHKGAQGQSYLVKRETFFVRQQFLFECYSAGSGESAESAVGSYDPVAGDN